jgi:hypothetical protein
MSRARDLANFIGSPATTVSSNLPSGSGLQLITVAPTTAQVNTTTSYADTGLTGNITPSSTSNKILITASIGLQNSATNTGVNCKLLRDSTKIWSGRSDDLVQYVSNQYMFVHVPVEYMDSPSSTSQITYKFQFQAFNGGTAYCQQNSTMFLQEIKV